VADEREELLDAVDLLGGARRRDVLVVEEVVVLLAVAAAEADALRRLRDLLPHASDIPGAITTRVEEGEAYRAILRTASDVHADLIVMGVRGRNATDLTIFGSTANHVVREAACPVLIVRCG